MSNVQTSYSTTPSANTTLGGLSMAEGTTQIRALNDAIRKLMADIREDSDEIREMVTGSGSSIASLTTEVNDALNSVNQIVATFGSFQDTLNSALDAASAAQTSAEQAADAAGASEQAVDEFSERVGVVETLAADNQDGITALQARVADLELSGVAAGYVQVDETMSNSGTVLSVRNVAIGGSLEDLATGRGQLGRTATVSVNSLDALVDDGWYAVPAGIAESPNAGIEGILRISSGYQTGAVVQQFYSYADSEPRLFLRASQNSGTAWSEWHELPSGIGTGLEMSGGVLAASVMAGADGTNSGTSGIVPAPSAGDANSALCGDGTWHEMPSLSLVSSLESSVSSLQEDLSELSAAHQLLDAGAVKDTGAQTIYGAKTFIDVITGSVTGSAGSATADGNGDVISSTYVPNVNVLSDTEIDSVVYVENEGSPEAQEIISQLVEEARAAALEAQTVAAGANSLASRATSLEGRATALEAGQTSLTGRVGTLESGQASLAGRVTTLETPISGTDINTVVYTVDEAAPAVEAVVADLVDEARAAATEARLYAADANSLAARVTSLESWTSGTVGTAAIDGLFSEGE